MARVTVEDCLRHVDNRFELVLVATKRARQLAKEGLDPLLPWDDDKPAVVALREIADDLLQKPASPPNLPPTDDPTAITTTSVPTTVLTGTEEK